MDTDILLEAYFNKLKNKYFGLLCEREKGRDWEKFLDSIIIELSGFDEENKTINWVELIKTVFECMGLLSKHKKNDGLQENL